MKSADPRDQEGLTFPWNSTPASWWRLLPGLLVGAVVIALMAVVFKVAAPPPSTVAMATTARGILLVDPNHPAAQGLLYRALDRGALLLGDPVLSNDSPESSMMPVFAPSFAGFEPRLKDPVSAPVNAPRQRLFSPEDLALPALPPSDQHSTAALATPSVLSPVWHGPLANLQLRYTPTLTHLRPLDLSRLRFQIGVESNGRVAVVAPLTASLEDRDWVPALQSALGQARFASHDDLGLRWGEVTFVWSPNPGKNTADP